MFPTVSVYRTGPTSARPTSGRGTTCELVALRVWRFACGASRVALRVWRFACGASRVALRVWRFACGASRVALRVWRFACGASRVALRVAEVVCKPGCKSGWMGHDSYMVERMKRHWREFSEGKPGERFKERYRRRQEAERGHILWRIFLIVLGAVIAVGS